MVNLAVEDVVKCLVMSDSRGEGVATDVAMYR